MRRISSGRTSSSSASAGSCATAAKLVEAATELKQREEDLRHRWQRMVTGMSQLKAEAFGDDPRTWSEADDDFLESWINADR